MRPFANTEEYSEALTAGGIARVLKADDKGTVRNDTVTLSIEEQSLPALLRGDLSELVLGNAIAHGGMGEVLVAQQVSLARDVAVKRPLGDDARAALSIIAEARVAGALEHPNIVPVHMLGADEGNRPLLVMKRIEGRSWSSMLREGRDLKRDIEILMDVCRALHFAHSRGIMHRDVKPANVMVGSFGEVYLLDWGIAAAISDSAPAQLQRAKDVKNIAGTPAYMAPEMAFPAGELGAHTDVFLAGAVLFELITGAAPWKGKSSEAALFAAYCAEPPVLGEDVPEELVAICRCAMHRDPAQRFASADEMRISLEAFRNHAAARVLCAEAELRLKKLEESAADAGRRDVGQLFAECRFGFTQALRTWPESARARLGLAASIEAMARHEIKGGHLDSAKLLLAELDDAPADLVRALAALEGRREHEVHSAEELARVSREHDVLLAQGERARLVAAVGVSCLVFYGALDVVQGTFRAGGGTFAVSNAVTLAFIGAVAAFVPRLYATQAARAALMTMLVVPLSHGLLNTFGFFVELTPPVLLAANLLLLGVEFASRATQDERAWPAAVVAWLAVWPTAAWSAHAYVVCGAGICAACIAAASVVRHADPRAASDNGRTRD